MNHRALTGFRRLMSASRKRRPKQKQWRQLRFEQFERRNLLTAILPAYVNGEFTFGDPSQAAPYGLENTFALASNPAASKTIYLDFDGHHSVNNVWGHDIQFPAFNRTGGTDTFADSELVEIQKQFQAVAEDFFPFDVNVTTIEPGTEALRNTGNGDNEWGIRVLNTQATEGFGNGIGGVAYLNSFSWNSDTPAFTFNKGVRNGGMTNSHEVGHALGLRHDGLGSRSYHPGESTGDLGWGPILGAPFGRRITQWSNGDYADSTNTEDDLAIISNARNGFGYRGDDHGGEIASASVLRTSGAELSGWGIVGETADIDMFSFQTGAGNVELNVETFADNPNLDIEARLFDSSGNVIATSNPLESTDASFNVALDAGTYYLSVDGVGLDGRYSEYGSLGFFSITGTRVEVAAESVIGEAGTIDSVDHLWQTITLDNSYENPAIVLGSVSYNGSHETAVRVRNVTSNSFEVRLQEWKYLDGWHTSESVSYVVVESGVHTLSDGTTIAAGIHSEVDHRWKSVDFGHQFDATPVVLSQATTFAGGDTIVTRQRNATPAGFSLKVQEEEAQGWHVGEEVSWIAIDSASGSTGDSLYEAFTTSNSVTHRDRAVSFTSDFSASPVFLAGMQTTDGGDTANIRHKNLTADGATIWVDEEQSRDSEVAHTTEVVGILALEAGTIVASTPGSASANHASQGSFGTGTSNGNGTSGAELPSQTHSSIDGTLGEGLFMELGHSDGHDCDHDHAEEEHFAHDHGDHHHGDPHDTSCGCDQCLGMMAAVTQSRLEQISIDVADVPRVEQAQAESTASTEPGTLLETSSTPKFALRQALKVARGASTAEPIVKEDSSADEFFADYEEGVASSSPMPHALERVLLRSLG